MTNIKDDHIKVHFRLETDEDGWPPVSVESLWAVDLGDGTVRLESPLHGGPQPQHDRLLGGESSSHSAGQAR
ncbi:hypothetical protein [Streptomyces sp. NPDC088910]|uniref:hypothetical protein n=1 Tax=Streptomyces sp. NPDC088910 TaxID=3365911 RepID=UPI00382D956D